MLELRDIALRRQGLDFISPTSLTFEAGSINVLLGRTLAGKTSMMRLMAGLEAPTSGSILWDGADVTGTPVRRRDVAMVYQQFVNYPGMSVRENIASPLRVRGENASTIASETNRVADLMQLGAVLDRKPAELSGGQQQRVALARALIKRAGLVLLDEPLANLDFKLREELREEIPLLFSGSGSILVYATTDPVEAMLLAGRTIVLHEGRVIQTGLALDVFRRPLSLEAMQILSDPPLNVLPDPDGGGGCIGFRAHTLHLGAASAGELGFPARVVGTEITGSETFIHLRAGPHTWVMVQGGVVGLEAGDEIEVHVATKDMVRFDSSGAHAPIDRVEA